MAGATKMAGAMPWHAGMPKLKKSMAYAIFLFFSFLRFGGFCWTGTEASEDKDEEVVFQTGHAAITLNFADLDF
jgi:hypothetical protein